MPSWSVDKAQRGSTGVAGEGIDVTLATPSVAGGMVKRERRGQWTSVLSRAARGAIGNDHRRPRDLLKRKHIPVEWSSVYLGLLLYGS